MLLYSLSFSFVICLPHADVLIHIFQTLFVPQLVRIFQNTVFLLYVGYYRSDIIASPRRYNIVVPFSTSILENRVVVLLSFTFRTNVSSLMRIISPLRISFLFYPANFPYKTKSGAILLRPCVSECILW